MIRPHGQVPMGTVLAVLVLASSASIMSTDMYAPSLPHLPELLGTTPGTVQLTMSLNLLAFAVAQLAFGPISDAVGRRPTLIVGMLGFAIASGACAAAVGIGTLIAARIAQGLFAAAEIVVVVAMIGDLYRGEQGVRAMAVYGMAVAMAPGVAPIVGGHLHVAWGWQSSFVVMGLLGALAMLLAWRVLPESIGDQRRALSPARALAGYRELLLDARFMSYALLIGSGFGVIYAFATAGPFILIERHGVATEHFGYYQAVFVAAFIVGGYASNRLVARVGAARLLGVGVASAALGALGIAVVVFGGVETPVTITAAMSLLAFGMSPTYSVATTRALANVSQGRGVASAMLSATEMVVSGLAAAAVGLAYDGTARPFAWTVLALVACGAVGAALSARRRGALRRG